MLIWPDKSWEDFAYDYGTGMLSFGVPELYHATESVYNRDLEGFLYSATLATAVHSTWYGAYYAHRAYDTARHGGKNVKNMGFHKTMKHKGAGIGLAARSIWPIGAAALIIYTGVKYKDVGLRYMGLGGGG